MSRSLERIVNRQVLRWNQQRAKKEGGGERVHRFEQQPMICISREFGGLGGEIGKVVARRLGFDFYGQELVHEIAQRAHVRDQLVESLDERLQDNVQAWVSQLIDGSCFAPSDYLRNLSKVVLTLGRHGRGVLIGRGAHLILNPKSTLRVRTFGPLEQRIEYIARRDGLKEADARKKVLRIDAERVAFYREHFGVDVGDPHLFDLLINVGTLTVDAAADLVIQAFHARFEPASAHPKSYIRSLVPEESPLPVSSRRRDVG